MRKVTQSQKLALFIEVGRGAPVLRAGTQGQPESLRDSCTHLHWTQMSCQSACPEFRPVLALGVPPRGRNPRPCPRADEPKKPHRGRRVQSTWHWERNRQLRLQVPRNPERKGETVRPLPAGALHPGLGERAGPGDNRAGHGEQHARGDRGAGKRAVWHRGDDAASQPRLSGAGWMRGDGTLVQCGGLGRRPCPVTGDKGHVDGQGWGQEAR